MDIPLKKIIIFTSIFAVILVIFLVLYLSFVSSKTISARLLVEKDSVFINGKEVFESQILEEKDVISVSDTGSASIILYESVVVVLDSGTTITLKEIAKKNLELVQENGGTWSQVTGLLGINKYTIRTSTSVASVRGTGFYFNDSLLFVGEGKVDYEKMEQSFLVEEGKAIEDFGQILKEREMTSEEKEIILTKKAEVIKHLKELRNLELAKHQKKIDMLKERYEFTDEDIQDYLEKADRGEINLEEIRDKSPIKLDSVEKIIFITNKIKEMNASL
jgi:hypothetical protein